MRRSASFLLMSLLIVLTLNGCRSWKDKDAEIQTGDTSNEAYFEPGYAQPAHETPTYDDPAQDYDPYVAEASSAPVVDSYPAVATARYHTVVKGDTLYGLARRYYSDQRRWKDLYEANRSEISDPNRIRVGQRLVIP